MAEQKEKLVEDGNRDRAAPDPEKPGEKADEGARNCQRQDKGDKGRGIGKQAHDCGPSATRRDRLAPSKRPRPASSAAA